MKPDPIIPTPSWLTASSFPHPDDSTPRAKERPKNGDGHEWRDTLHDSAVRDRHRAGGPSKSNTCHHSRHGASPRFSVHRQPRRPAGATTGATPRHPPEVPTGNPRRRRRTSSLPECGLHGPGLPLMCAGVRGMPGTEAAFATVHRQGRPTARGLQRARVRPRSPAPDPRGPTHQASHAKPDPEAESL